MELPKGKKASALSQLLNTDKPEEQVKLISQLIKIAKTPVLSLLIQADLRTGSVDFRFIGGENLTFDTLYAVLEAARQSVMKAERAAQEKQAASEQPQEPAN